MLKFCLKIAAAAAVSLIGAQAYAADLPVKAPPVAPITPAPLTWTGFYIGANIGYGWANVGAASFSNDLNGVIGGGQIGYNWQTGGLVLGVEGDFQGSGERRSDSGTIGGIGFTVDQDIPWFATIRGRLGYAAGPWLFYGTGGAAWQNYKLSVTAPGGSVSDNATKAGWTAGGGVEWMFAPQWSLKAEYLYMDTGNTNVTLFGTTFTGHARNNIARVGVNYHF
jgi:outer membrane immunogenic protein